MKYNGIYLNFGVAVEKDGYDWFSNSDQFYDLADELNEDELECVITALDDMLNDIVEYKFKRLEKNREQIGLLNNVSVK